ncbi:MAG: ribokinase [Puniceicoccaceae bacterium 5H]|nr:MAG: ribokinase [Puniceicoccaceae bacterium 5H]
MPLPVLNVGSLNLDHIFRLEHFVRPGETLAARDYAHSPGGKGLNQSLALARAGGRVFHAGAIGPDGASLKVLLQDAGVDTRYLEEGAAATGQAVIQVDDGGENAILLYGGANHTLTPEQLEAAWLALPEDAYVLTQNETNLTEHVIHEARRRGFRVVWNPAPITDACRQIPLTSVDYLIVNEVEATGLCGFDAEPDAMLSVLHSRAPQLQVVMTLGARGVITDGPDGAYQLPAAPVEHVVDTTAAGDTFIGYFLAAMASGRSLADSLKQATAAAAWCVQQAGAAPSIPLREQLVR